MKITRFFYPVALLFTVLMFISCGGKKEPSVNLNEEIVGRWFWEKITVDGKEKKRNPGGANQGKDGFVGCKSLHGYIVLLADGTGSELFYDYTPTGCKEHLEKFTWELKGKQFTQKRVQQRSEGDKVVNVEVQYILTFVSLSKDKNRLSFKVEKVLENNQEIMLDTNMDGRFDEELWYFVREEPLG